MKKKQKKRRNCNARHDITGNDLHSLRFICRAAVLQLHQIFSLSRFLTTPELLQNSESFEDPQWSKSTFDIHFTLITSPTTDVTP